MIKLVWLLATAALVFVAAAQLGALRARMPGDLGVTDGRLKPPSRTRNSVSSQAVLYPDHPQRVYAQIDPLPFKPAGAEASLMALRLAIGQIGRIEVIAQEGNYLYAQASTRWLRFTDDLEFWADPARSVIDLRSASRLGREDFGANRARIEAIRAAYLAQP